MTPYICEFLISFILYKNNYISIKQKLYKPSSCENGYCLYNINKKYNITIDNIGKSRSTIIFYNKENDKIEQIKCVKKDGI